MSGFSELHWGEGMFLLPQHFQLWQRQLYEKLHFSVDRIIPYAWGVRRIEVSEAALENFKVSVASCDVRLPDGTELRVPENADLPELDFEEALKRNAGKPIEVHLGVAVPQFSGANVSSADGGRELVPPRFRLEKMEVADENTGGNSRSLDVRRLNARLCLAGDAMAERSSTIPIIRIVPGVKEGALPRSDSTFVPPTLEIEGSPRLDRLAKDILERALARSKELAETITQKSISFRVDAKEVLEWMLKLHTLNCFVPWYRQFLAVPRLHPLRVYLELCRLAGHLAIFSERRLPPEIPLYDHRGLGPCFTKIYEIVENLLSEIPVEPAPHREFQREDRFLVAVLDGSWFDARNKFFIAVDSNLSQDEVERIMAHQVSIGSRRTIKEYSLQVVVGIGRTPVHGRISIALPVSPLNGPDAPDRYSRRNYFWLDRKGGDKELLADSGGVAIYNGSGKDLKFSVYVVNEGGG